MNYYELPYIVEIEFTNCNSEIRTTYFSEPLEPETMAMDSEEYLAKCNEQKFHGDAKLKIKFLGNVEEL